MSSKKKPKVHRYYKKQKSKPVTGPGRTFLSVLVTLILALVLGVVGYSVAKPIMEFFADDSSSDTEEDMQIESTTESIATETTITTETTVLEEETEEETSEENTALSGVGVRLDADALSDATSLSDAIANAMAEEPDCTYVIVPLKVEGGAILYQTEVTLASTCGAAQGTLTLEEIVGAVEDAGLQPVAECSLLYDNLLPDADSTAGYLIESSSTRWLDNSADNGGEPWVSPFSSVTVEYLTDITTEIAEAGFSEIWCCDVIFPDFRSSDLEYIGEIVQDEDRGEVLVELLETLADAADSVPLYLETDAASVMEGTDEAFDPDALTIAGVVLDLETETSAEDVQAWMETEAPGWSAYYMIPSDLYTSTLAESDIVSDTQFLGWVIYT